ILPFIIVAIGLISPALSAQSGRDQEVLRITQLTDSAEALVYSDPDKALSLAQTALERSEKASFNEQVRDLINVMGNCHYIQGNYPMALEKFLELYALHEKANDTVGMADALSNSGLVYKNTKDYQKALDTYQEALRIIKNKGNDKTKAKLLNNMGVVYRRLRDYDKARAYYDSSLTIKLRLGDPRTIANGYTNIGVVMSLTGNQQGAIDYFKKALKLERASGLEEGAAKSLNNIAEVYWYLKDFDQVLKYASQGYEIASKLNTKLQIKASSGLLSEAYASKGQYKKAYEFHRIFASAADSLFNANAARRVGRLESKLEIAKKENQIKLLDRENQLATAELRNKRTIQLFLIISLVGIVAVGSYIFYAHRQRAHLKEVILHGHVNELRTQVTELLGKYEGRFDMDRAQLNDRLVNPVSEREYDVLKKIFAQKTNQQIAEELYVSINTVKTHLKNIYDKLGVSNRTQAIEVVTKNA
ncbi:MAG: tetratricopeptide repeat protein, partial [Cyclobacteriaceae bacterium]|nr:tetratricopeptide repeat protein [Cyclobacteriaceae bacterium HetDA_MAG_MS6]